MNEVAWHLDKGVEFRPMQEGWELGDLYISKHYLEYKEEQWVVRDGVYDRFISFLELLGFDTANERDNGDNY